MLACLPACLSLSHAKTTKLANSQFLVRSLVTPRYANWMCLGVEDELVSMIGTHLPGGLLLVSSG